MSLKILLSGATGVLGRTVAEVIECSQGAAVVGTASRERFFDADVDADVIIDFSHPDLLEAVVRFAADRRIPLVTGTTGFGAQLQQSLDRASEVIPICQAANFSLGVNLLVDLSRRAARALGEDFDVEIVEAHHRRKLDAPSGTALWLGEAVASARGHELPGMAVHDRSGERRPRGDGEIGFHAIRGGEIAGEHTVHLLGEGERLELTHRSGDRRVFARGALLAARRIAGRSPGRVDFAQLVLEPT